MPYKANNTDKLSTRSRGSSSVGDPTAFTGINNANNNDPSNSSRGLALLRSVTAKRSRSRSASGNNDFMNHYYNPDAANLRALAKKYNGTRRKNGLRVLSNNALAKKLEAQSRSQANMRRLVKQLSSSKHHSRK